MFERKFSWSNPWLFKIKKFSVLYIVVKSKIVKIFPPGKKAWKFNMYGSLLAATFWNQKSKKIIIFYMQLFIIVLIKYITVTYVLNYGTLDTDCVLQ